MKNQLMIKDFNNKTAFLTIIFPTNERYIYDFFNSLENQTFKDFDIVVINDGYKDFDKIKSKYTPNLNIIEIKYSNSIAKNREEGINYCIDKGYNVLIFGDIDDYFEKSRVEKSIKLLQDYDIIVNDLTLFDENGIYKEKYFSNRIRNMAIIDFEFIKDKNIFGLSNTAIKLNSIKNITIPNNLIVIDWYIFSILLINGGKAIFTNETLTYYRQHNQNIVGLKKIDLDSFKKGIKVKTNHYKELNNFCNKFDVELKRLNNLKFDNKKEINNPLWWELI